MQKVEKILQDAARGGSADVAPGFSILASAQGPLATTPIRRDRCSSRRFDHLTRVKPMGNLIVRRVTQMFADHVDGFTGCSQFSTAISFREKGRRRGARGFGVATLSAGVTRVAREERD